VTLSFEHRQPVEDVRDALSAAGLREVHIQYQEELAGGVSFLQIKTGDEEVQGRKPGEIVRETLTTSFPEAGFKTIQEDEVGAQIGAELKGRAIKAILWSLVGIIVYIAWRFELGFAVGAIVALVHDVLITAGVYVLCGRQLSLPVIAALLTIVGYSVNDTIVVFDRIREDLRLARNMTFKDICNLSINQTLSRTVLTSLTTMITVLMMLIFGGGSINDFALTLFIGILVGTYSSIFIATPVVLLWHRDRRPELGGAKTTVK
jgi:SecD/SecF fusion protein